MVRVGTVAAAICESLWETPNDLAVYNMHAVAFTLPSSKGSSKCETDA